MRTDGDNNKSGRTIAAIIVSVVLIAVVVLVVVFGKGSPFALNVNSGGFWIESRIDEAARRAEKLADKVAGKIEDKVESIEGKIEDKVESIEGKISDKLGGSNGDYLYGSETYKLPDVEQYIINVPAGDVYFETTDESRPYIQTSGSKRLGVLITENGDECKVNFTIDVRLNSFNDSEFTYYIYLPKNIDSLSVKVDAGRVTLDDLSAKKFKLDVGAGAAVVDDCDFDEVSTAVGAGKADIYVEDRWNKLTAEVAVGSCNIYLQDDIRGFKADCKSSMGTIEDETGLLVKESGKGDFFDGEKSISYGNEQLEMKLTVSVGAIRLYTE